MTDKIVLNDGTELDGSAINDENILWIDVAGTDFDGLFYNLSDPEKTMKISVHEYGVINRYDGFTDLFYLRKGPGKVSAGLEKVVFKNV